MVAMSARYVTVMRNAGVVTKAMGRRSRPCHSASVALRALFSIGDELFHRERVSGRKRRSARLLRATLYLDPKRLLAIFSRLLV